MEGRSRFSAPAAVLAAMILVLLPASPLTAERLGESSVAVLPDGAPRFTQTIRWKADPNVLYYEAEVLTRSGEAISIVRLESPVLALNLPPGEYRYRITLFNFLKQPEVVSPWHEFTVLRAEMPRIASAAPGVWFLEDRKLSLAVFGEDLVPGATVALKPEADGATAVIGTELERDGTSSIRAGFSADSVAVGTYSLEVTNPGGLSFTLPRSLLVRHKLPAPSGLAPAPGTVLAAPDLRGLPTLRFDWEDVPEATRYVFRLYGAAGSEPIVSVDSITESVFALPALSILDRGSFRWTVEAFAMSGSEVVIPAAEAAEATFSIDLPLIAAPVFEPGDTFYGR
jgi:hypothetical protein